MKRQLTINGTSRTVDVPADMPLLWVLRDELGLTGTKYGCGIGACGACTVHVDGRATRSCQIAVSAIADQPVTTIEGLSATALHPVQSAWLHDDVAQCGYCQSGQIMVTVSLLQEHAHPSDAQIDSAMSNICRCGSYQRIRSAIHRVAGQPTTPSEHGNPT